MNQKEFRSKRFNRIILGILAAIWTFILYVFIPAYIFDNVDAADFDFGDATVVLGDFDNLKTLLQFFGLTIVGISFSKEFTMKETSMYQIWKFLKAFGGIIFFSIFMAAGFTIININTDFGNPDNGTNLNISLDITVYLVVSMGRKIFKIIIIILDLFIARLPEEMKAKHDKYRNVDKNKPYDVSVSYMDTLGGDD